MMGGLFIWLIVGVALYLLLSRRGGMTGCCGGHRHHPQDRFHDAQSHENHSAGYSGEFRSAGPQEDIIDLKEEDYHVTTR